MIYLPNAIQMQEADRHTIQDLGISSLILMERAARSCVKVMEEQRLDLSDVCIVCGSGNNGGDGFAIGRMLLEAGRKVTVCFIGSEEKCTSETNYQIQRYREIGGIIRNTYEISEYSVIIDAIFGVGLCRQIEGNYKDVLTAMNASEGVKVAVDVPSGISASTGSKLGIAFRADLTATFQAAKLGLLLYPGHQYAGKIIVTDIGIDDSRMKEDPDTAYTFEPGDIFLRMPGRLPDTHKGSYGKVLVIAGSQGMAGAAYLNAYAAYMTGAGLVRIYTTEDNRFILQQLLPEAIVTTYGSSDSPSKEKEQLLELLCWADTVCIGSGIGKSTQSKDILHTVLEHTEVPCVIDADGINLLSENRDYLNYLSRGHFILTPHLKEMTRILGCDILDLKNRKVDMLKDFVTEYKVTCALKDARTFVACTGKQPYVNLSGNSAMAKAGSGDVLTGVVTGLLAQGMECYEAAVLGVYLHGLSGDKAKMKKGSYSVLARDLVENISCVLKEQEDSHDERI